jgi:hypothetical protein
VDLIEALLALEHAAAVVESFLPVDADPAQLAELLDAWAPPRRRSNTSRSRELQLVDWIAWLRDCGERWEARPPAHPSGEQMAALIIRWAQLAHTP